MPFVSTCPAPAFLFALAASLLSATCLAAEDPLPVPLTREDTLTVQLPVQLPVGSRPLFNGKDLSGWRGQIAEDPRDIAKLTQGKTPAQIEAMQAAADAATLAHWQAVDGQIHYDGTRRIGNLETRESFGDFELYLDWKIPPGGDSGVFPRNMPQVQIWDPAGGKRNVVGSGGLDNNSPDKNHPHLAPTHKADKPVGEWNTFAIKMVGDKVWVRLNGELVVDGVAKGNYWTDFKSPPPARGPIVLQSHGSDLWFRNLYVREIKTDPR
ncbi:3-keto-disaccharide hydrolase [Lignipirellula cremea]|uniref:3-keto-alpha-glucoside-1,2-lyase/3-keto-2-hydroxy-glucal hydratase domain-containing protein n=1 Tax=Lignipirellula cremea TaxID=2528010 RepID=A0A518DQ12_9BACT|nr:DUF1080 domain-containing protein [Lignipirellula cremea]QDU93936.1 hypothetical protein Pla8534_17220 [Lignipirellula cremea]